MVCCVQWEDLLKLSILLVLFNVVWRGLCPSNYPMHPMVWCVVQVTVPYGDYTCVHVLLGEPEQAPL